MFSEMEKDPQIIHHLGARLQGGIHQPPTYCISDIVQQHTWIPNASHSPPLPQTAHTMKNSDHQPCPLQAGRITGMIHLSWIKPPTLSPMSWCSYMYNRVLEVFIRSNRCPAVQSFLPQSISLSTPLASSILSLATLNLYVSSIFVGVL